MKLRPEVKDLWVSALLSDVFKQGRGQLRRLPAKPNQSVTHCCLGVLCEVHRAITKAGSWDGATYVPEPDDGQSFAEETILPLPVIRWAFVLEELDNPERLDLYADPTVVIDGDHDNLTCHNDGDITAGNHKMPRTFVEIAHAIHMQL